MSSSGLTSTSSRVLRGCPAEARLPSSPNSRASARGKYSCQRRDARRDSVRDGSDQQHVRATTLATPAAARTRTTEMRARELGPGEPRPKVPRCK